MPVHVHPAPDLVGVGPSELVTGAVSLLAAAAYLAVAARLRRRGDRWPVRRDMSFLAGAAALAGAMPSVLPGGPFTAHMAQHLLGGMAAPLLMMLARPLTLALRALPPGGVRHLLVRTAHSRPVTWLLCPPVAAVLNVGGLLLLYRTTLLAGTHHQVLLHAAVHAHVLMAGILLTVSLCHLEPVRQQWSLSWRGGTLLAIGAAHAVLAKSLYVTAPPGTSYALADLRTGAQLMYYGGDLIEIALATVIAAQWYASTGRALLRSRRTPPPRMVSKAL